MQPTPPAPERLSSDSPRKQCFRLATLKQGNVKQGRQVKGDWGDGDKEEGQCESDGPPCDACHTPLHPYMSLSRVHCIVVIIRVWRV